MPFTPGPHMFKKIIHDRPQMDQFPNHFTDDLKGLVEWLLDKDPVNRPTIDKLLNALAGLRESKPVFRPTGNFIRIATYEWGESISTYNKPFQVPSQKIIEKLT